MTLTFNEVQSRLLPLQHAREVLGSTEPLGQHTVHLLGEQSPKWELGIGFNTGLKAVGGLEDVKATVRVGDVVYRLTKDALLEATTLIGLTKAYVERTPASLLEPHLNYWFANKDVELKMLTTEGEPLPRVLAFTKGSIVPFSNLQLLEGAVESLSKHLEVGEDAMFVDWKLQHDLRLTRVRLVAGQVNRSVEGTPWSVGVQIQNSIVAEKATGVRGYLFGWKEGNGLISTHADSGNWNRRTGGQGEEVYGWAKESVWNILSQLEHELEAVEEIAKTPLTLGLVDAIHDVFSTYKVPEALREGIVQRLVAQEPDPLTMYHIMQAISEAANDPSVGESARNTLMEIAGDLPLANSDRCASCYRLKI